MNMPPPQCPPPDTDCIFTPSTFTHEFSYPCQRHVGEAPIGSMTYSFNTCGNGRRHTCNNASASRFTRTSLYFQCVPGSCGAFFSPPQRSAHAGLPHNVPSHSLVWFSSMCHVIFALCSDENPPS